MIVIIPLGGLGERFKKYGYKYPKPLINVMGKPIIFWLLDNLVACNDKIQFILMPYNKELKKYNFESLLTHKYPTIIFKFLSLEKQTQGAAETILMGLESISMM